jgi:hypothetical protein
MAAQHHTAEAKAILAREFHESLATMLRCEAVLRALSPCSDGSAHRKAQHLQRRFQDAVQILTPRHFVVARTADLVEGLRACGFVGVDSSVAVASAMVVLQQRAGQLSLGELAAVTTAVATCKTSLSAVEKTEFIVFMLQQAVSRLEAAAPTETSARHHRGVTPADAAKCIQMIGLAMRGGGTGRGRREDTSVFPFDLSKRFVEQFLVTLLAARLYGSKTKSSEDQTTKDSDPVAGTPLGQGSSAVYLLKSWQLPLLCTAVVYFGIPIGVASRFLQPAAALAVASCREMTSRQLSHVLLAYATVGYRNTEFFVTIGQCVGDLGETAHEDDIARVLRALALVGIEHEMLRNSLESSLRMRSLHRKPLFGKSF